MASVSGTLMPPIDWQCSRPLTKCNKYMLDNQVECDVTFILVEPNGDQERTTAHKFVLISRSPVFFAMLSGPLAEQGQDIRINDISVDIFGDLLRYLYEDDVTLTEDNVFYIMYAAKKYLVTSLIKRCSEYLYTILSAHNVCTLLENSFLLEEDQDLLRRGMEVVKQHSKRVFHSDAFYDMSRDTLCKVLKSDTLTIHEIDVFRACIRWATRKCNESELEITGDNLRMILEDSIKYVHLPTLSVSEFTQIVLPTQVLSTDEENILFRYLLNNASGSNSTPFPTRNRECVECKCSMTYEGFVRHTTSYTSLFHGVPQRSKWHISIYSDHTIKLREIAFMGKFKGTIIITQNGVRKVELSCNMHISEMKLEDDSVSLDAGLFTIATDSQFSYLGEYYSKGVNNPVPGVECDQDKVLLVGKDSSSLGFLSHISFIPTDEIHFVDNYYSEDN